MRGRAGRIVSGCGVPSASQRPSQLAPTASRASSHPWPRGRTPSSGCTRARRRTGTPSSAGAITTNASRDGTATFTFAPVAGVVNFWLTLFFRKVRDVARDSAPGERCEGDRCGVAGAAHRALSVLRAQVGASAGAVCPVACQGRHRGAPASTRLLAGPLETTRYGWSPPSFERRSRLYPDPLRCGPSGVGSPSRPESRSTCVSRARIRRGVAQR
jgi:hypothetical protein